MTPSSKRRYHEFRRQLRAGIVPSTADEAAGAVQEPALEPKWPLLEFYFRCLGPYKWQIGLVFGLALTAAMLGLIPPYGTKLIIDEILQSPGLAQRGARQLNLLHLAGIGILALLLLQQGIDATRTHRMHLLNMRVLRRLQQRLYDHLLRLPIHELQEMKTGRIVTRLSSDVDDISGLLQMAVITPGVAVFRVVTTMGILLWIEWRMAVVAVVILVPVVFINLLWIRKLKPLHRSIRRDRGDANARVVETFAGLPVVRVFRRERTEARDFAVGQNTIHRKRLLSRLYHVAISTAWGFLIPLSSLLIVWYGGTRFLLDQVTIGAIVAFQMYVFMLLNPISMIVQSWSQTQQGLAALERTVDVLQRPVDLPDRPGARDAPPVVETLRFEGVTFGYNAETPVLTDVSLTARAGQIIALVGPSGAGKTTLINLLARFYDPDQGRICLNGIDLRDLKLDRYRSLLGIMQQDVFLFDGPIRDNIAYGRKNAGLPDIAEAARRANAHGFITDLPDGYDTVIGERGIKLSGGQKQRVGIARAILADPQILILDEATSNLDSESEALIQASLSALLANRTTFVIAHRLSTVIRADVILVMDDGRIIERGTHAELLAEEGLYKQMVLRQMRLQAEIVGAANEGIDWS